MTEREKMLAGQLYDAGDAELKGLRQKARENMAAFNEEKDGKKRASILKNGLEQPVTLSIWSHVFLAIMVLTFMLEKIFMPILIVPC